MRSTLRPTLKRVARVLALAAVAVLCVLPAAVPVAMAAGTLTGTSCTTSGTTTTCTGTFSDGGSGTCTAAAGAVCAPAETVAAAGGTPAGGGLPATTTSALAQYLTPNLTGALANPAVAMILTLLGFGLAVLVLYVMFEAVYHLIRHMRAESKNGIPSGRTVVGPIIVIVVMMLLVSGVGITLLINVFNGLHTVVSGAAGVVGG